MTQDDLQRLIDSLDEKELEKNATFGIYLDGGGTDECSIHATKEGLALFALSLFKAAKEIDQTSANQESPVIRFSDTGDWFSEDSDVCIHSITLMAQKPTVTPSEESPPTIGDNIAPWGCGLLALVLVVTVVIGAITIIQWILHL